MTPAVADSDVSSESLVLASEESAAGLSSSEAIWQLLDPPFGAVDATRAMFGLSPAAARYVVGREVLISDAAGHLLEEVPSILRYMVNQSNSREVRSVGAVVGPIQWQATITARAAAGFPEDLFICAAPYRDFDMPENQLLVYTLKQLANAGRSVTVFARDSFDDERISLARERARQAGSHLDFRSLAGVSPRNDPQTLRRTRRSSSRKIYAPVLNFLPTLDRPLSRWAITHLGDRRTAQQHKILLAIMATLRREGVDVRPFTASDGVLSAGPIEYRHPGSRGLAGAHGIRVGHLLLDVPDVVGDHEGSVRRLGQRSGMLTPLLVESMADISDLTGRLVRATDQISTE